MNKPWFETWFDSPYYHILYKERDHEEAHRFLDKLIGLLTPATGAKVLDVACGKGRHSLYLNRKGFDVSAFDLSDCNIEYDKQFENEKLSFYMHDMREVFRVNYYDYVFNLFSSFGYFDYDRDNANTIYAHAQALKRNGLLVLDFMNADKAVRTLVNEEVKEVEGIKFTVKKKVEGKKIIKQIIFSDKGESFTFEERVGVLFPDDFEKLFAKNHLQTRHVFGDYALNPFDKENSDRLILIAEKTDY